ncbi:MAG: hypothetical protein P8104_03540 [Gammaproteobacteria bacterium]
MIPNEDYQMLWLVYYAASALFVIALMALCWRWRFAYVRFWLPCLVGIIAILPLPVDQASTHSAPMIVMWLMSIVE